MRKSTKKAKIPVRSIQKYKDGYFVESNKYDWGSDTTASGDGSAGVSGWLSKSGNVNAVNSGAQLAASGVNMLQPSNGDTNKYASMGSGALSGAGEGAKLGSAFGPEGTLIGAGVGLVGGSIYGLLSGGKKHDAYVHQQEMNTQNAAFNQRGNMQTQNVDPYGTQMAYGDMVPTTGGDPNDKLTKATVSTGNINWPAPNSPYWKSNPLVTEHSDGNLRLWGEKPTWNTTTPIPNLKNPNNVLPSDKALGQSDIYYPSNSQPKVASPATIQSNSGYYANGASIGLTGQASGRFHVPNAGLRRFAPHMQRVGKPNILPSNTVDFNSTQQNNIPQENPQSMAMGDNVLGNNPNNQGDSTPVNSMQNQINIQKGELLIDPNKGRILQEYNGINPLTGGMFEPHAKDQRDESPNNFTLADPGLFVITKKTAKQYKDAVDNNDKISQKTVLMNIRNAKIAKEGGLQPLGGLPSDDQVEQGNYADGDQVQPIESYGQYSAQLGLPSLQASNQSTIQNNLSAPTLNTTPLENNVIAQPDNQGRSTGSKIADTLTNYGPAAFNIAQGLFGNVQHQAYTSPITNPYANQVIANMPKNVNMQPVTNDIYSNQALADKSLQDQTNSSAVYRSNRQNLAVGTNRSLEDARMKASEINNQAAGQRAYMYNALGYQNQQEQEKVRDYNLTADQINMRGQAAKQNLLNAGLSQLQQTSQNDKLNTQKAGMDKLTLQMLAQTFPNTKYYNQFQIDYINKQLGR